MFSSLACAAAWAESVLGMRCGTYPPEGGGEYAVASRVGGEADYPHDSPRIAVQVWARSDEGGERAALALARRLPELALADPHINAVEPGATVTQMGRDGNGRYIWQASFTLHCNIREDED